LTEGKIIITESNEELVTRIRKSITKFELKPDDLGSANASLTTSP